MHPLSTCTSVSSIGASRIRVTSANGIKMSTMSRDTNGGQGIEERIIDEERPRGKAERRKAGRGGRGRGYTCLNRPALLLTLIIIAGAPSHTSIHPHSRRGYLSYSSRQHRRQAKRRGKNEKTHLSQFLPHLPRLSLAPQTFPPPAPVPSTFTATEASRCRISLLPLLTAHPHPNLTPLPASMESDVSPTENYTALEGACAGVSSAPRPTAEGRSRSWSAASGRGRVSRARIPLSRSSSVGAGSKDGRVGERVGERARKRGME
ncbi:hypothetical protein R3P38DRAFT_1775389 [Favolaschia claudopus]|uniref:Uncharacterized protein n=1 Tax=Favolaschia claudopus TaxID=2862362 RepID=A0AAW0A712_9AGAR